MRNNSSKMKVYRIQISPLRLELNMFTRFPWRARPQTPCKHSTQTVYMHMYMYEKFKPSNQYHLIIPHHTLLVFTRHIITSTLSPPPLTSTSPPPLLMSHYYLHTITSTPHIHITTSTPHITQSPPHHHLHPSHPYHHTHSSHIIPPQTLFVSICC